MAQRKTERALTYLTCLRKLAAGRISRVRGWEGIQRPHTGWQSGGPGPLATIVTEGNIVTEKLGGTTARIITYSHYNWEHSKEV